MADDDKQHEEPLAAPQGAEPGKSAGDEHSGGGEPAQPSTGDGKPYSYEVRWGGSGSPRGREAGSAQGGPASRPEPGKAVMRGGSYAFLVISTAISLAADLVTKGWAKDYFEGVGAKPGLRRMVLVEDLFSFILAKNQGGAWGLFQNENEALRRPFFLVVSVAAIIFIVSLYRKLHPGQTALKWGLPLVLGGALGNFVDRIRYGHVIDFIDVYFKWWDFHWPTFNVADIAICVGVGLMAIDMFSTRNDGVDKQPASSRDGKSAEPPPPAGEAPAVGSSKDVRELPPPEEA